MSVQDQHIKALQGQLKEAETLLASTIYQAKQKLANISRSSPVLSEDLIKYSHRISASNAVCAPLNWQQGDPRYIIEYNVSELFSVHDLGSYVCHSVTICSKYY